MTTVRRQALAILLEPDPDKKAALARSADLHAPAGGDEDLPEPPGVPGRPPRPILVPPSQLKQRSVGTTEGRAALLHALAHIEFNAINLAADLCWRFGGGQYSTADQNVHRLNAINLALDIAWRFPGLPDAFYVDWLTVAREEALHFQLLRERLKTLDRAYGDFPAHDGLWDMAGRTRGDLLARLALVPRTLEARGLDASPPIRAKLAAAGDAASAAVLDVILRDEIGHVAIGNRWYRWLCAERGLDPLDTYDALARRYGAPRLRGPFNVEARRAAGFDEAELARLGQP